MESNQVAFAYMRRAMMTSESFDKQYEPIKQHAEKREYRITRIFKEEAISGNKEDRPGILKMLEVLETQRQSRPVILIESPKRLARNLAVYVRLSKAIEKAGGRLEVVG